MASKKAPAEAPQPSGKGRKPVATAELVTDQMDGGKLAARSTELQALAAHQQQLVDQFGDGLPWHPDHYEAAIRGEFQRGCEAFLRAGSLLIVARECSVHGEWGGMLSRLGIGADTAQRMMTAARRVRALPNAARARHLIEATGTQSKLVELLSLPDDQFTELAEKGETDGLSLDDVEIMSRDELRAAVREARADLAAKDERNQKLAEAAERAKEAEAKAKRKWRSATPDERQVQLEQRVVAAKLEILAQIGSQNEGLTAAFIELAEHCNENDLDSAAFMGDVLGELLSAVRVVRDDYEYGFAIPAVNDGAG